MLNRMLRHRVLPWSLLLALLLTIIPFAAASAKAETVTSTDQGTLAFNDVLKCGGTEPYRFVYEYHTVYHSTMLPNDTYHVSFKQQGQVTATPLTEGLPTYTGQFNLSNSGRVNQQTSGGQYNFSIHLTGDDGSQLNYHQVVHLSVNANGQTLTFNKPVCQ